VKGISHEAVSTYSRNVEAVYRLSCGALEVLSPVWWLGLITSVLTRLVICPIRREASSSVVGAHPRHIDSLYIFSFAVSIVQGQLCEAAA
jgi:hypothetical protein